MTKVTASELKNNLAEILNKVIFTGSETVIIRHGKPVAKIAPIAKSDGRSMADIKKALDKTFGSDPDFPEVTKFRTFGRKVLKL